MTTTKGTAGVAPDGLPQWLSERRLEVDGLSLDDYVGAEYARAEARSIVGRLAHRGAVAAVGVRPPRGMLVTGPVGVGKTHLARVIVAELSRLGTPIDCFEVRAADLTPARLEELQATLGSIDRQFVIVVDEADHLGGAPSFARMAGVDPRRRDLVIALLSAMDGLHQVDNIFWVLATSDPTGLDAALVRPGRIDLTIELDLPTEADREELARYFLRNVPVDPDLDVVEVAAELGLRTPASIQSVLGDAYATALVSGARILKLEHIRAAIDRSGRRSRDPEPDGDALRRIALHEAGHAVVSTVLGLPPSRIRLEQESGATSFESRYRTRRQAGLPDSTVRAMIAGALAGTVTEHVILGEGSLGGEHDLVAANELARARLRNGCDPEFLALPPDGPRFGGSGADTGEGAAVEAVLRVERARAAELVVRHREAIETLAGILVKRRRLAGDELEAVLASCLGESVPEEDAA